MITSIHYSFRFKKQFELLLKADKKGILAARQAEVIVGEVRQSGSIIPLAVSLKRTKHGERRAQNCEKYDLGGGYRLITFRDGTSLYVAFVGTHDECDLWFKQRRAADVSGGSGRFEVVSADKERLPAGEKAALPSSDFDEDEYESELLSRIDDATLSHVFSGFYQEGK